MRQPDFNMAFPAQGLDAVGQQAVSMEKPSMAGLDQNTQGWLAYIEDFLSNQDNSMPLLQAGLSMMAPQPKGGNFATAALQGINAFQQVKDKKKTEAEKVEDRRLQQELAQSRLQTEAGQRGLTEAQRKDLDTFREPKKQGIEADNEARRAETDRTRFSIIATDRELKLKAEEVRGRLAEARARLGLEAEKFEVDAELGRGQLEVARQNANTNARSVDNRVVEGSTAVERIASRIKQSVLRQNPGIDDSVAELKAIEIATASLGRSPEETRAQLIQSLAPDPESQDGKASLAMIDEVVQGVRNSRTIPGTAAEPNAALIQQITSNPQYQQQLRGIEQRSDWTPAQKNSAKKQLRDRWIQANRGS
jgi:hypothetical protein